MKKPKPPTLQADFRRVLLAARMMANRMEPAKAQETCRAADRVKAVARGLRAVNFQTK